MTHSEKTKFLKNKEHNLNKRLDTTTNDRHYYSLVNTLKFVQKQLKILTIIIVLTSFKTYSQDKRFTVYGYTDPSATHKDGFNIGMGIEYQMQNTYVKTQLFAFPNLRGKDYLEWSTVPFTSYNLHSFNDKWRLYSGFKLGLIKRESTHPFIGFEGGIDYYFNNGTYIGLISSYDLRTDGKEWEADIPDYWRFSGFIKVGFAW